MTAPAVSIVICTFNRLALLKAAVESCLRDASPAGLDFEVVIADNSPSGHARAHAEELAAAGHPVLWVGASPPNISLARNAGLRTARAGLVAFLDDDSVVEPGWLDHFVGVLESTGADVAVGPVRPLFDEGRAPDWDAEGHCFTRVLPAPTGTPIRAGGKGRPRGFAVSTASSIWRRDTCFTDPEPFDPAFGASGGEDLDLFLRLEARGCRFVWCAEAGVRESVPASRTRPGYQILRAYSGGQVYAAAAIHNAPSRPRTMGRILAVAAVQTGLGLGRVIGAAASRPFTGHAGGARLTRSAMRLASAAGKLAWWRKLPLYHVEKPPAAG